MDWPMAHGSTLGGKRGLAEWDAQPIRRAFPAFQPVFMLSWTGKHWHWPSSSTELMILWNSTSFTATHGHSPYRYRYQAIGPIEKRSPAKPRHFHRVDLLARSAYRHPSAAPVPASVPASVPDSRGSCPPQHVSKSLQDECILPILNAGLCSKSRAWLGYLVVQVICTSQARLLPQELPRLVQ